MTVETVNFLPDFDINLPAGTDPKSEGDDHMRNIKNGLVGDGTAGSGSFTPNFTGQYTGTADELNGINAAKVDSFNTRTGDVVPDNVDYSATSQGNGAGIAKLADWGNWSGVNDNDIPLWKSGELVPQEINSLIAEVGEYLHYDAQGLGSNNTRAVYFQGTAQIDNLGTVARVVNNNASSFVLIADKPCVAVMTYSDHNANTVADIALALNGDFDVSPLSQAAGVLRALRGDPEATAASPFAITASVIMAVDDVFWINSESNFQGDNDSLVQLTVTEIIQPF